MEKGAASQIVRAVDTNRGYTAELGNASHCHVRARHCQEVATLVTDGENGITDLGKGTVTENSVYAQRCGHDDDHLKAGKVITNAHDHESTLLTEPLPTWLS
ncbi:hypothetical protein [Streptomyces sp900116325]|uniref:hypothetical protein n=1 Tax=Streptomyces sp. 900116325 TaxID=3154295 RepID=UPI003318FB50